MSVPGGAGDPCAGSTACGTLPGRVVAVCSGGAWSVCSCVPGVMAPAKPAQSGSVCGNNIIEAGETCEKAIPVAATCGMLIAGSTGIVNCVDCHYDTQLCTVIAVMNSMGAAGSGSASTGGTGGGIGISGRGAGGVSGGVGAAGGGAGALGGGAGASGGAAGASGGAAGGGACGGTAQPCCPGNICNAPNGFCHFDVGICFP